MSKELEKIGKDIAETMAQVIPEGYVVAFVVLPQEVKSGCEYMLGSIPTLRGGSESILGLLETIVESTSKEMMALEFERKPKH